MGEFEVFIVPFDLIPPLHRWCVPSEASIASSSPVCFRQFWQFRFYLDLAVWFTTSPLICSSDVWKSSEALVRVAYDTDARYMKRRSDGSQVARDVALYGAREWEDAGRAFVF